MAGAREPKDAVAARREITDLPVATNVETLLKCAPIVPNAETASIPLLLSSRDVKRE